MIERHIRELERRGCTVTLPTPDNYCVRVELECQHLGRALEAVALVYEMFRDGYRSGQADYRQDLVRRKVYATAEARALWIGTPRARFMGNSGGVIGH